MNLLKAGGLVVTLPVLVVSAAALFGSFYTVDEGERAVITTNGRVVDVAEPGLHFKLPLIQAAHTISIRSGVRLFDKVAAYSKDQQTAEMKLSVNFKIPPGAVRDVYTAYGNEDNLVSRLLDRRVYEQTKNVFGRYDAVSAIQKRSQLNAEIADAIVSGVKGPILVESVQVENIDFSDAYEAAIEARMNAQVEVEKIRQNAEREKVTAEITVTKARAAADSTLAQAEADAKSVRLRGDAEAAAIEARGKALANNPNVVGLVQAERWNGVLPTTMVPGSAIPFISVR